MFHRNSPTFPTVIATAGFTAVVLLSGCGKGVESEGGKLTRINGKLVQLDPSEEEEVCSKSFCEPNYLYSINFGSSPSRKPSKPKKPKLPAERVDYAKKILNVDQAWELTKGSREVIVAVVDTGVELNHPDLKNNVWTNWAEYYGDSGVDDDGNGYVDDIHGYDFFHDRGDGDDDNRHGTHCAGIIGAEENGVGTIGISPLVKIMPLKFLGPSGSGDTMSAVKAIKYAVANGAHIISNSWGGGGYSEFLKEAIDEAVAAGVLVVAAAGNAASNNDWAPSFPASYAGVIAVASTDSADKLSSFSNYGYRSVTIAAPGSEIYSSVIDSKWANLSGTSMATPQVAGALALAKAVNPGATAEELKSALCETSAQIHLTKVKCGRMDVGAFIGRVAD